MSTSNHVGPIIFADENARQRLQEQGWVVTFRASQRTTGETWWRKSRTGSKEGDVIVTEIGEADASEIATLRPYARPAGFETPEDWQTAIRELNGNLPRGYLYEARLPDTPTTDQ
jgi:hypothetical protein